MFLILQKKMIPPRLPQYSSIETFNLLLDALVVGSRIRYGTDSVLGAYLLYQKDGNDSSFSFHPDF